jgi:hypothetical protein
MIGCLQKKFVMIARRLFVRHSSSSIPVITRHKPNDESRLMEMQRRLRGLLQQDAEQAYKESFSYREATREVFGNKHPAVASAMADCGTMAMEVGGRQRLDEAIELFNTSLQTYEVCGLLASAGASAVHQNLARALRMRALVETSDKAKKEILTRAMHACELAVRSLEKLKGVNHPDTVAATRKLAMAMCDCGDIERVHEAEQMLRRAVGARVIGVAARARALTSPRTNRSAQAATRHAHGGGHERPRALPQARGEQTCFSRSPTSFHARHSACRSARHAH